MGLNYAARIPQDGGNNPLQNYPAAKKAETRYVSGGNVSSVVTLTDNTTVLELSAAGMLKLDHLDKALDALPADIGGNVEEPAVEIERLFGVEELVQVGFFGQIPDPFVL